jgi:cellulose synthase/poly-beta-1,6-N-acetylglucosamine synthase-like glycosyltransferase
MQPDELKRFREARFPVKDDGPYGSSISARRWRGRVGCANVLFIGFISGLYLLFGIYAVAYFAWWFSRARELMQPFPLIADILKVILTAGMILYLPYLPYRLFLVESALHPDRMKDNQADRSNGERTRMRDAICRPPADQKALPRYVVMVPVYNEASIAPKLVESLSRLQDYHPTSKNQLFNIEVAFLVESEDYQPKDTISSTPEPVQKPGIPRVVRRWPRLQRLPFWFVRILFFLLGLLFALLGLVIKYGFRLLIYPFFPAGLRKTSGNQLGEFFFGDPLDSAHANGHHTPAAPSGGDSGTGMALVKAIRSIDDPQLKSRFRVLVLPPPQGRVKLTFRQDISEPKTKPRALNFGLYHTFRQGEKEPNRDGFVIYGDEQERSDYSMKGATYCVVFDAEDRPEPDQLIKAYQKFNSTDPADQDVYCWQGKLGYENLNDNWIISLFKADYSSWYELMLPGLDEKQHVIPLGGTSNHFKVDWLRDIGGWDAFNVTEDADLGVWIYRAGGRVGILDSITWEEANHDTKKWIKQRSRWIKGYMQTFFTHFADVGRLNRELNQGQGQPPLRTPFLFLTLTAGFLLPLLSPVYWTMMLIYIVSLAGYATGIEEFKVGLRFISSVNVSALLPWGSGGFFVGNAIFFIMLVLGAYKHQKPGAMRFIILWWPLYWVLMSRAAIRAFQEYIGKPFDWAKSDHSQLRSGQ